MQIFTAVDAIFPDEEGRVKYHYAILEVAAVPQDDGDPPIVAGDDALEAVWMDVATLKSVPSMWGVTYNMCDIQYM